MTSSRAGKNRCDMHQTNCDAYTYIYMREPCRWSASGSIRQSVRAIRSSYVVHAGPCASLYTITLLDVDRLSHRQQASMYNPIMMQLSSNMNDQD